MVGRGWILWLVGAACIAAVAAAVTATVPEAWFVARGLLASVLLLAGAAKLRDRASFSKTLMELGVGPASAPRAAVGLPVAELTVAGALLVPASAGVAAAAAVVLLLVLSAGVVVALARGRTADCGCFGKDHSARLGGLTLVRNGMLVGLAAGLVAVGPRDLTPSSRSLAALAAVMLVPLALLARRGGNGATAGLAVDLKVVSAGPGSEASLTRRRWLRAAGGAGLATAIGVALDPSQALGAQTKTTTTCKDCVCCARVCDQFDCLCVKFCCTGCTGFSGGGVIQTSTGAAQASFFGDKMQLKGSKQVVTGGALSWFDAGWEGTGLTLQSTRITGYRRVPGTNVRELTGVASANGKGKHKFVLRITDGGIPGSGSDTVDLTVSGVPGGGAGGTGSQYKASGHLVQGDLTTNLQATVSAK
jgi:hypothetical protein